MDKLFTLEQKQEILREVAQEYGLEISVKPTRIESAKLEPVELKKASTQVAQKMELEPFITRLGKRLEELDLERIFKENGNNSH